MRILAFETSGRVGSVAALEVDGDSVHLLREIVLGEDQRTAQRLAPALRNLLSEVLWSPREVQLVAVAVGPGSFTGLRIGVTAAKTFAYAVGAEVIGVNTLAVLAAQAQVATGQLWAIMDAQRHELFVANFDKGERDNVPTDCAVSIVEQNAWLANLQAGEQLIGPVLKRLAWRLPEGVVAVDESQWQPTAASVGKVAWQAYSNGQRDDLWKLSPQYYRLSAAEEKRRSI